MVCSVEHQDFNLRVKGSSPLVGTFFVYFLGVYKSSWKKGCSFAFPRKQTNAGECAMVATCVHVYIYTLTSP